MQYMEDIGKTFLFLLSLWGILFAVSYFGKVRIWFVPVTCAAGISLVLFWGGLSDRLALAADLVFLAGLAGGGVFIYCVLKGRIRFPVWSLFGACFGAGVAVFTILIVNLRLLHYDNFSHWALVVKYLLTEGSFPGGDAALIPFRDYPPGSSVFIYYVCRFAGRSQGVMLLAQNSMIISCFFAVFGIVKERRRFLLYSFLAMGCAFLSYLNLTIRINNLLVDFLLPLLAMASVAEAYRCRDEKGKLCILEIILLGFTGRKRHRDVLCRNGRAICTVEYVTHRKAPWRYHLRTDLAGFQGKFEIGAATAAEFKLLRKYFMKALCRIFCGRLLIRRRVPFRYLPCAAWQPWQRYSVPGCG